MYIPTGISTLDAHLGGGLPIRTLTELCGPPGAGKTQFCLSLCLETLKTRQENINVIFIDTELKYCEERLLEMAQVTFPTNLHPEDMQKTLLDKMLVIRPLSSKQLAEEIDRLSTVVLERNVGLVVIDSIAALLRKERLSEDETAAYVLRQVRASFSPSKILSLSCHLTPSFLPTHRHAY